VRVSLNAAALTTLSALLVWKSVAQSMGRKATADALALGQYLSLECVTCHQASGRAVGGVPAIVGRPL
jgi:mono/diheme cytochrome c family protein